MLLNLKKMRKDKIAEKLFRITKKYADAIEYQDQDAINIVMRKKIKELPDRFNFRPNFAVNPHGLKNAVIIHYACISKPWHFNSIRHVPKSVRIWRKYKKINDRIMISNN